MLEAFSAEGRFYKGNIHTHSIESDGASPAEEVCKRYRAEGYDFLCVSDHFLPEYKYPITNTLPFQTEEFTTILGAELHAPATHLGELWHILAVGLPLNFAPPAESETGAALAWRAREAGAFIGIAHPQWYALDLSDGRSLDAAHAVEIYNFSCEMASARPDGTALWDGLLLDGRTLTGIATDDAHFHCADAFGGWINVKAANRSPDALLDALKLARFYASQGPELLSITREADRLVVVSSPARSIVLVGPGSDSVTAHGDRITSASLDARMFAGSWCRVVVTDSSGKRAWSQPLAL